MEKKITISGTGRCGTTFLMILFTCLDKIVNSFKIIDEELSKILSTL